MISKEQLLQVILEQRQTAGGTGVPRLIDNSLLECPEITVITGVRRCGKSILLRQIQARRKEKDYYLNFDDERLLTFTVDDFQTLCEVFAENFGEQKTFYLDEVQNVKGWERFVSRLYNQGCKVFVTGSNANLLSRELGTFLTGRHVTKELYPFSFGEYLSFKKFKWNNESFYTTTGKASLLRYLKEYLEYGGFPQYVVNHNENYLQSLYNDIIYRDVLVRNRLSNAQQLRELVYYLASNATQRFTYNSLAKAIEMKTSDTVRAYIGYLEETYLISQLVRFDYSLKSQTRSPKKIYFIDNAVINKVGFNSTDNQGRMLENAVYIELKRRNQDIYYYSNGAECDFIVKSGTHITQAIQVTLSMSDKHTAQREETGVLAAMEAYKLNEGFIITMDESREIKKEDGKVIHVIPIWKWMLTPPPYSQV